MENVVAKLEILEYIPQEFINSIQDNFIKSADCYIIQYLVNSESSYKEAQTYIKQILQVKDVSKFPMILVGNNPDTTEINRQIPFKTALQFAVSLSIPIIEISSTSGINIDVAFSECVWEYVRYKGSSLPSPISVQI